MKPKSSDICPVCTCKTLESVTGPDDQANISWIRCDICRQWYHSLCLKLTTARLGQISLFHCPECEKEHGPSHEKRQLKRARVKIDYVALDQGETFAVDKSVHPHVPNFLAFEPLVECAHVKQQFIDVLDSRDLSKEYVFFTGLTKPVIVPGVTEESGLQLPQPRETITVKYIAEKTGCDQLVEVMDVLSQQSEQPAWSLRQWRDYFYTPESERDRIRNVISLEVSQVEELGTTFTRPKMVTDLDLVDKVWCDADGNDQKRPQVTIYCLMSVRGSYTDFHIDFSGTPVYYTVCHGAKTFLMYPPSANNLALYESWCLEPQQNFTWFAEYTKRINGKKIKPSDGFKVNLKQGDLFIIPSGWIHSVYTPEDAVIIGGNYLTLRDLPMHLKIYDIEKRTRVPSKYRFPVFNKVLWLTSWYYFNHKDEFLQDLGIQRIPADLGNTEIKPDPSQSELLSSSCLQSIQSKDDLVNTEKTLDEEKPDLQRITDPSESHEDIKAQIKDETNDCVQLSGLETQPHIPAAPEALYPRAILQSLITHLEQHYEVSKTQPIAKKSIPTRLIGKNIKEYLGNLESWLETL